MIIDLILALVFGISLQSFWAFFILCALALPFTQIEPPYRSGLFKVATFGLKIGLMALGISALFSMFGGGDDCDFDA